MHFFLVKPFRKGTFKNCLATQKHCVIMVQFMGSNQKQSFNIYERHKLSFDAKIMQDIGAQNRGNKKIREMM